MNPASILPQLLPSTSIPPLVAKLASRLLGFDELSKTWNAVQSMDTTRPLTSRVLEHLEAGYRISPAELERIPRQGAAVIVANHPFGILEGVVLGTMLLERRSDVRFLANGILTTVLPELRDLVIPVDPISVHARGNASGMRAAVEHLRSGGLLVVFPAGEVSSFDWESRETRDRDWHPSIARMIRLAEACVIPMFLDGSNSALFQMAGMLHPRLRTALLAREFVNKRRSIVQLRVGKPVLFGKLQSMKDDRERIAYLRWRTDLLGRREPRASRPFLPPVCEPVEPEAMQVEADALGEPLAIAGDLRAYLATADAIPNALREIGRLREIAFRAAGEGTGRPLDLDRFDQHYLHLFIWNARKREIAGAYRMSPADCGPASLYTNTLFRFGQEFLDRLGPAVELGRSFVRVEYQKSVAPLVLLWKGIGAYLRQHPQYQVLFGPVSISNQYQSASRELMIAYLERRASLREWAQLVRPRNAPKPALRAPVVCRDLDELSEAVNDLETGNAGVPVLLRQYLKLGGKLLGFNVDRDFSNALDGLIVVNLRETEPKLLERYLGSNQKKGELVCN
jgi:putative hemolysin